MIEKMKFVSITGPREDIDRVVNNYLSRYEIHLENALTELTDVKNLSPYLEINPYKEALSTVGSFYEEVENPEQASAKKLPIEKALSFVQQIKDEADVLNKTRQELEEKRDSLAESLRIIYPFRNVDFDVQSILKMRYIHYRFGRIEKDYFDKFKTYIYDNLDTIFIKCDEDDRYIWGIYFVPVHEAQRIHAVYSAMHFEKIFVPDQYDGTAKAAYTALEAQYKKTIADLDANKAARKAFFRKNASDIVSCKHTLSQFSRNFDIRKLAACTHGDNKGEAAADYKPKEPFYILCGWMTEKDAKAFQNDISGDSHIFCLIDENEQEDAHKTPPTKLKNPKLFKPFEMYTKMYGLPAYGEMDPTWFIAITYSFIFGAMFGDAGQGLVLLIGGYLLYRFKHIDLAGIISCAGIFSTFFGFMFGSVFGFEDIIEPVWLRQQIGEALFLHNEENLSKDEIEKKVEETLELVGIPKARKVEYPYQFSGGMRQRVVIAIALVCNPALLIADEPTTALDVTIQAQILTMICNLQRKYGTSVIMITHDLGVVAETCDKVAIMYAGEAVEYGTLADIFTGENHHPYTVGLFGSIPSLTEESKRLHPIEGLMPDPTEKPAGCWFAPRCRHCTEKCKKQVPPVYEKNGHQIRCHLFGGEERKVR